MLQMVVGDHQQALQNFMKVEPTPWGEATSFWADRLRQYVRAINTTFGTASFSSVTKDLIGILRATQYSITDRSCFQSPPSDEAELHARIEAVLRCVFPDLRRKPPIGKPIKNFEPDTGLPSVQTLIEYKFASSTDDVKRIADEVLADTRGYASKDWTRFVYVIYETKRLKSEVQWVELLKSSEVTESTQIIVLPGEEPRKKPKQRNAKNDKVPRA